jgi:hypothetical protein
MTNTTKAQEEWRVEFHKWWISSAGADLDYLEIDILALIDTQRQQAGEEALDLVGDPEIRFIEWRDYVEDFYQSRQEGLILSYPQWLKEKLDEIRDKIKNI